MNYSLDHNLLQHPKLQEIKGSKRRMAWIIWCATIHFTKNAKDNKFILSQGKFAKDFGVKDNTVKEAIAFLVDNGLIKRVKLYQRKGNQSAHYVDPRYSPMGKKVYPNGQKGIAQWDKVNNSKGIINQKNDSLAESSSSIVEVYTNDNKPGI
jgi:DNA-binding Lrp family transcriptional regulator